MFLFSACYCNNDLIDNRGQGACQANTADTRAGYARWCYIDGGSECQTEDPAVEPPIDGTPWYWTTNGCVNPIGTLKVEQVPLPTPKPLLTSFLELLG